MVRPHDIAMRPDPDGSGVVVGRHFRGAEHLYVARLPSGLTVQSSQPHIVSLTIGSRVHVTAEPGHSLVLFDGEDAIHL